MLRQIVIPLVSIAFGACGAGDSGSGGSRGKNDEVVNPCPVTDFNAEKIEQAIEQSTSCFDATNIAERCAFGSTMDIQFVGRASEVCGKSFDQMTAEDKAAYERLLGVCAQKYENEMGTMYRSMAAFCQLEVTKTFNLFYPEPTAEGESSVTTSLPACPVSGSDAEAIEKAISDAQYCYKAASVAESCAFGSSIDGAFVGAATEVCEKGFAAKMSPEDTTLYHSLIGKCAAKYANEMGTMYLSMAAFCGLQITEMFDSLYSPVEG
jgi:hypothetical protein